jgi:ankyrin repeat protein
MHPAVSVSTAVEKNQVKLLQHLAPRLAATPAVIRPKPFSRYKQSSIWNSAGETPLTLAARMKHDKAACAMLAAGFKPLQLASVLLPGAERDEVAHALLLAAKVRDVLL